MFTSPVFIPSDDDRSSEYSSAETSGPPSPVPPAIIYRDGKPRGVEWNFHYYNWILVLWTPVDPLIGCKVRLW